MFKGGYQLIDFTKYELEFGNDTVITLTEEDAKYYWNIVKNVKNKFLIGKLKVDVNSSKPNDIIYIPFISHADLDVGYNLTGIQTIHMVNTGTGATTAVLSNEIYVNLQEQEDGVVTGKLITTTAFLQLMNID